MSTSDVNVIGNMDVLKQKFECCASNSHGKNCTEILPLKARVCGIRCVVSGKKIFYEMYKFIKIGLEEKGEFQTPRALSLERAVSLTEDIHQSVIR